MIQFQIDPAQYARTYLASGSTHVELAQQTSDEMGIELGNVERKMFPNTELYIRYGDSIRGKHVFIIQSLAAVDSRSVNDSFMEALIMVDAAKRASASEITVVVPYLAYGRQDRKARGREPISAAAVIRSLQSAGADRIVSVDMHSAQTQATFNGPFDHLTAETLIQAALEERVKGDVEKFVVVSPDGGRAKVAEDYANELGVSVVHMTKSRDREDSSKIARPHVIAGVEGLTCLMIDDIIDTAGTLVSAAETLKRSGAARIITCATHGIFSKPALERLMAAPIDEIIVTNTVPLDEAKKVLGDKLEILSIAPILAQTLTEITTRGSVSKIFNDRNYH
ncbi:MAG: Ribose-phosphate pyrophosphokinae [Candidatus Saccharibacteria bacterium]|nr:Ribose-phosphate pyrophosphokinae [Candidatus Saccharibacteria bacterium]